MVLVLVLDLVRVLMYAPVQDEARCCRLERPEVRVFGGEKRVKRPLVTCALLRRSHELKIEMGTQRSIILTTCAPLAKSP